MLFWHKIHLKRERLYEKEKKEFPEIEYPSYRRINRLWETQAGPNAIIPLKTNDPHLRVTAKSFRSLAPRNWLNDEVVNDYIRMMNEKLLKQGSEWIIVHSLFMPMLLKPKPRLEKALGKLGYSEGKKLVFAINFSYHWFFVAVEGGQLSIYDSLRKRKAESYIRIDPLRSITAFAADFLGQPVSIRVDEGFPQQDNGHDCGIMMLFGIKDVVRRRPGWTTQC